MAQNAIPEDAIGAAAYLDMTPSTIGEMAATAGVKQLVLSHLMRRTIDRKDETLRLIFKLSTDSHQPIVAWKNGCRNLR